jgi:hypothetical protein
LVTATINLNSLFDDLELLKKLQINARIIFMIQETA